MVIDTQEVLRLFVRVKPLDDNGNFEILKSRGDIDIYIGPQQRLLVQLLLVQIGGPPHYADDIDIKSKEVVYSFRIRS